MGVGGSAVSRAARLGVFGGTFDPPHLGHLAAAQEASAEADLERVVFVPAGRNPLKVEEPASSIEHRVAMTELAVADNPCFSVSRADVHGHGPSYTVNLLERLSGELGPEQRLHFIVGMDVLHELHRWRTPERVLQLAQLIAVSRPGQPSVDPRDLEAVLPGAAARVSVVLSPGVAVSSRELRGRVAVGLPIRYLAPDAVCEYIARHGLYR